jgi:hypothetical protein
VSEGVSDSGYKITNDSISVMELTQMKMLIYFLGLTIQNNFTHNLASLLVSV